MRKPANNKMRECANAGHRKVWVKLCLQKDLYFPYLGDNLNVRF